MIIIADKKIPDDARKRLEQFGKIILLETKGVTYPAISGHPDIFFCRADDKLVVSPGLPPPVVGDLKAARVRFVFGDLETGSAYPETARLNAAVTPESIFHNEKYTDPVLKRLCAGKQLIHVNQGYTRCNLIPLKNNRFIASDKGIEKTLRKQGLEVLYVDPKGILLPGFKNGFIGGTCGIVDDNIFFIGSLNYFPEGEKIKDFLFDYKIIELYDGPLFDGGSLMLF